MDKEEKNHHADSLSTEEESSCRQKEADGQPVYEAILLAAGSASRFNTTEACNKVLMPLEGRAVFTYSLHVMLSDSRCRSVWIVTKEQEQEQFQNIVQECFPDRSGRVRWVIGGKERQDSVHRALDQLTGKGDALVLIHDAARPFLSREIIDRLLLALDWADAVVPGIRAKDSLKTVSASEKVTHSLDRSAVRHIQTPQVFRLELLNKAFLKAKKTGFYGNEEGELLERLGIPVYVVQGDELNFKITTPLDYHIAQCVKSLPDGCF